MTKTLNHLAAIGSGILMVVMLAVSQAAAGKFASSASESVLSQSAKGIELIMAEEQGCMWCERWEAEIGVAYPKTEEGQFAPLKRIDIADPMPEGYTFAMHVRFTPTFILVRDGQELARIEGHPGDDFFWPMLEQLLKKHTDFGQTDTTHMHENVDGDGPR